MQVGDPDLGRRLALVRDVDLRSPGSSPTRIVASPGARSPRATHRLDLARDLGADPSRYFTAVDDRRCHRTSR